MASPGGPPVLQPGQQPTPEQIAFMQKQLALDAAKNGMTVPEFIEHIKKMQAQQVAQQQAQQQQQQQQQQAQTPQPILPGPPKPEALAVASFLRGQDLKTRTVILGSERKQMYKVKRALRALESPAYAAARAKNPLLPEITDRASLENTFKLLPMSLISLRVSKVDPHEGHDHAPPAKTKRPKGTPKGLWTVKIESQQECSEMLHYVWLQDSVAAQWKARLYAFLALACIFAIVLFPLWPMKLRLGAWYLSMIALGLVGLLIVISIIRLIVYCITVLVLPRAFWIFPRLFDDVSFTESFVPVWGWQEDAKKSKKKAKASSSAASGGSVAIPVPGQVPAAQASISSAPQISTGTAQRRNLGARVEEVFDED